MPLDIKFKENNSKLVYNYLSEWSTLVQESNHIDNQREERSSETREVLFEKFTPFFTLRKKRKKIISILETSGLLFDLRNQNISQNPQLFESQASHLLNIEYPTQQFTFTKAAHKTFNGGQTIGISSRGFDNIKKETFFTKIKSFFVSIWNKIFKKKKIDIDFHSLVFPIIRRVAAQTISMDLISVQPLSMPTGNLFYFGSPERENVYSRVVLFEKYKPIIYSGETNARGIFYNGEIDFE